MADGGAGCLAGWADNLVKEAEFVATVIGRFKLAANPIRAGIDAAANLGDADTADLFTEISRKLDKSLWMLEASK